MNDLKFRNAFLLIYNNLKFSYLLTAYLGRPNTTIREGYVWKQEIQNLIGQSIRYGFPLVKIEYKICNWLTQWYVKSSIMKKNICQLILVFYYFNFNLFLFYFEMCSITLVKQIFEIINAHKCVYIIIVICNLIEK